MSKEQDNFFPQNDAYINGVHHQSTELAQKQVYNRVPGYSKVQHQESTELLKNKVQYLQRELTELSKVFSEEAQSSHLIEQITFQNQAKTNQINQFQQQVNQLNQKLETKQNENVQLRNELLKVKAQHQKVSNVVKDLKQDKDSSVQKQLRQINIKLSEQIQSLLLKIHNLHKEFNEQQCQKQSLMQHIQQQNQFMQQMKDSLKDLTEQNTYLKQEVSKVTEMSFENQKQLQDQYIKGEIDCKQEIEQLKNEIIQLKNKNKTNKVEQQQSKQQQSDKQQMGKLQVQIQNQRRNYQQMNTHYQQKIQQIQQIQTNAIQDADHLRRYKLQVEQLQNNNKQLSIQINKMQEDLQKLQQFQEAAVIGESSKVKLCKIQAQNDSLKKHLQQYQSQCQALKQQNRRCQIINSQQLQQLISPVEYSYVCSQRDALLSKVQSLKLRLQELLIKLQQTQRSKIQLQCRYNTLQLTLEAEIQKSLNKDQTLHNYQTEILHYQSNQKQYSYNANQLQNIIKQYNTIVSRYEQLSQQLKQSQLLVSQYEQKLTLKQQSLQQLKDKITNMDHQNIKTDQQNYQQKVAYEQLLHKYDRNCQQLQNVITKYQRNQQTTNKDQKENDFLKIDNASLRAQVKQLQVQIQHLKGTHQNEVARVQRYQNAIREDYQLRLNQQRIKLQRENDKLGAQYTSQKELKKLQQRIWEKDRHIAQGNIQISVLQRKLQDQQDELRRQRRSYEIPSEYRGDIRHHPQVKKLQSEIVGLQRSMMQKEYESRKLIAQLKDENEKLKIENAYHRNCIKELYAHQDNASTQTCSKGRISGDMDLQNYNNYSQSNKQYNSKVIVHQVDEEDFIEVQQENKKLKRTLKRINVKLEQLSELISEKCQQNDITPREPTDVLDKTIWLMQKMSTMLTQYRRDMQVVKGQKKEAVNKLNKVVEQSQQEKILLKNKINTVTHKLNNFNSIQSPSKNYQSYYQNTKSLHMLSQVRSLPKLNLTHQQPNTIASPNNISEHQGDENRHRGSKEVADEVDQIQQSRRNLLGKLKSALSQLEH